jgi:hypothetical protein
MLKNNIKSSPFLSKKVRLNDVKEVSQNLNPQKSAATPSGSLPVGAPVTQNLNFNMQPQQQDQWCWSAVAVSTSLFYNAASTWTQCSLANRELNQTICCQSGSSSACNQPWYLNRALQTVGYSSSTVTGSVAFSVVYQTINMNAVLGVRIQWLLGGGHFVILDGWSIVGGQYLSVRDPWYGTSTYSYSSFVSSYQGTGSWTHTYYT